MELRFARILSYLLHPAFMPTLSVLLILLLPGIVNFKVNSDTLLLISAVVFFNTAVMPILTSYILLRFRFISSLEMQDPKERILPYFATIIYYIFTYTLVSKAQIFWFLETMQLGAIIALTITLVVTNFWKISAHMVGIGGLTGSLAGFYSTNAIALEKEISVLILLSGVLGTARLLVKAHTPGQIYAGWFLGFLCVWGAFKLGI
jgi:membrane-associated phospholipid phosphatase